MHAVRTGFCILLIACQGDKGTETETGETDEPTETCIDESDTLNLAWPMDGVDAKDWVVSRYIDLDSGPDVEDYTGNTGALAKTYDGHNGVDIGISSFRKMDEGIPVYATVSGTVEYVIDGFEDRHSSCIDDNANIVGVRHESGSLLHYVHLRTDSTTVGVGDSVEAGDELGQVGSSGCSDGPHLHFEITGPDGNPVDPFLEDLWCDPPVYDTPLGFMEGWILEGPADLYENPLQDPPAEATEFAVGEMLLAYSAVGGGLPGEEISVELAGPDGSTIGPWPVVFEQSWQLTIWSWAFIVEGPAGPWTARTLVNGDLATEAAFEVLTTGQEG
jgi:hypothetical protein